MTVEHSLYSTRQDGDRAVAAMELGGGVVEGYFTPLAAHAAWAVAHLTPQETEAMFARLGGMNPSKSSLDRLPKALSALWEDDRSTFEQRLASRGEGAQGGSLDELVDASSSKSKDLVADGGVHAPTGPPCRLLPCRSLSNGEEPAATPQPSVAHLDRA